jgi:hypothetical protein
MNIQLMQWRADFLRILEIRGVKDAVAETDRFMADNPGINEEVAENAAREWIANMAEAQDWRDPASYRD